MTPGLLAAALSGPPNTRRAYRDPKAIFGSALKLWLRADAGITVTGSGVSQWSDQSGNGNHAVQGTDAARPLVSTVAGRPSVDTDANRYLTIPDAASLRLVAGEAFSIFCVVRSADTGASRGVIGKATNAASGIEYAMNLNDGATYTPSFYLGGTGGLRENEITVDGTVGEDVMFGGKLLTNGNFISGLNGAWAGSPTAVFTAVLVGTAQLTVGRYASNAGGLVGSIREICIVRRATTDLTAAEERALLAWFRSRWPIP